MRVTRLELRDFRNYEAAELELPAGLAVVVGPNGAGKTNLLEAVYFGCTGALAAHLQRARARAPRRRRSRAWWSRRATRTASHRLEAGFEPGEAKRLRVDGSAGRRASPTLDARPLVSVFLPERLELVKGAPAGAARPPRPGRGRALAGSRRRRAAAYSRALAQRNALLGRIRAGASGPGALDAWDAELAREGIALMEDRAEAVEGLREPFARLAEQLGLPGPAEVRYRPRSARERRRRASPPSWPSAAPPTSSAASPPTGRTATSCCCCSTARRCAPTARRASSAPRCWRCCSPSASCSPSRRGRPPLMLLDDVMSELDSERRELLADLLRSGGQAIVTATEADHVPGRRRGRADPRWAPGRVLRARWPA